MIAIPTTLVGRERELATLREHLAAALAGRGSPVLIGGEAGIGKTALAEAICTEAAERGAMVLVGRCYDLAETPPYGPWAEALARAPADDELPLLPAAVLPPERDGAALASQSAIVGCVRAYLAALAARRPLAILLEDLHWGDPASLDLLRVVARGLADVPILLLATYRTDEVANDHPLAALLPAIVRESRAERLDLRPLDAAAVGALVTARYTLANAEQDRLTRYLAARTEGNALFLGELLRTLEGEGVLRRDGDAWVVAALAAVPVPALLRQVIGGRLARLGEEAGRLLAVAATIGQEVPLALWAAVAGTDEDELLDTVERATGARLLVEAADGNGVRFAHALVREAIYEGTPLPRRRAWHRRAGETLIASPTPDPDAVAGHFRRAGDPRAQEWLVRAGERAQRAYAHLTAAERYEGALALLEGVGGDGSERVWLLLRLAAVLWGAAPARAAAILEEAGALAERAGARGLAAYALFQRGRHLVSAGDNRGVALAEAGFAGLGALDDATRARLLAEPDWRGLPDVIADKQQDLVFLYGATSRFADALRLGEPLAEGATNATLHYGLAEAYAARGQPDRALVARARCRIIAAADSEHARLASSEARTLDLVLAYDTGNLAERRRLMAAAVAAGERASGSRPFPALVWGLPLLVLEGRWAEARRVAETVAALGGVPAALSERADLTLLAVSAATGAWEQARAIVHRHFPGGPGGPAPILLRLAFPVMAAAARLTLDEGDLATARAWLDAHDRALAQSGAVLWRAEGQLGWAVYHRAAGDPALARRHAEQALAAASEPRQPLALLAAHRLLGELDTEAGGHAEAEAQLDAALALAAACAAPYERALTLLALAGLRLAGGDRTRAGAALAEARGLLVPLDARPALARADALAARITTPGPIRAPRAPRAALPFGLTAREVGVLRLVVQGRTNDEIAAALGISRHTVAHHITHLLTKTSCDNRAALAALAIRHALA